VHHHDGITLTDITCRCNLVVIGVGAGSFIAVAGSAEVGAKVALIEEWMMGGDCLDVGCIPSMAKAKRNAISEYFSEPAL